jgi:hypothetical protein
MATNTIVLKGDLRLRHEEFRAGGTIRPGHNLIINSSNAVVVNNVAAGAGSTAFSNFFAKEDALQGKTVDDAYASSDLVPVHMAHAGDKIQGRVAAAAVAIVVGDRLVSNGDGCVKKAADAVTGRTIGIAAEAVDNSAGGSEAFVAMWIVG